MSTWQPIETLTKDYKGQFVVYWRASVMGSAFADMMGGWDEYQQVLDFGEAPASHWMPIDPPVVVREDAV